MVKMSENSVSVSTLLLASDGHLLTLCSRGLPLCEHRRREREREVVSLPLIMWTPVLWEWCSTLPSSVNFNYLAP